MWDLLYLIILVGLVIELALLIALEYNTTREKTKNELLRMEKNHFEMAHNTENRSAEQETPKQLTEQEQQEAQEWANMMRYDGSIQESVWTK